MSTERDFTQKRKPLIPPSPDGNNSGDEGVAVLLDSLLPGGKRLRDATGKECLQAGGDWIRWVGESVGEQDIIGATLSEAELIRIFYYGPKKSTDSDFTDEDRAYCDALNQLAKALVALGAQAAHELIEEDAGSALLFDLSLAITGVNKEFHDELYKLACGDNTELAGGDTKEPARVASMGVEAEVFFGSAEEAAAGQRALEATGFEIEPRRPGDNGTVWMLAHAGCPRNATTAEMVRELEALIKPHGGRIWELGPAGEPAPPRLYEMAKRDPEQPGCNNG